MNKLKEFVAYTFILLLLANILLASMFVTQKLMMGLLKKFLNILKIEIIGE